MSNKIVVMKLVTLEEVIAEEVDGGMSHQFKYRRPRVIQLMQTEVGVQPSLIPWLFSLPDETVPIGEEFMLTKVEAGPEISKAYLQATTSLQLLS